MNKLLLTWFLNNRRDLPWRRDRNWYRIWISEVMLQQTQVSQVIPYFHRFLSRFPTVDDLAAADEQEVLKLWEGLGYYSRARNLHKAGRKIVAQYEGVLPKQKNELGKIPGFGPYTTNAVLSLAFNQPYAVVDGNVIRCLTRLYAIPGDIRKAETVRTIQELADSLLDRNRPAEFNEALMELGATVCIPQNPDCKQCPLQSRCKAYQNALVAAYPYKSSAPAKPKVVSVALIVILRGKVLMAQRPSNGLLGGLWEFPCFVRSGSLKTVNQETATLQKRMGLQGNPEKKYKKIKHSYTHFNLELSAILYRVQKLIFESDFYVGKRLVLPHEIEILPSHRAMGKLLAQVKEDLKIITQ